MIAGQLPGRRRRNAHANVPAELDLQRRPRHRSLFRRRRDHHLGKSRRSGPQIAAPTVNQAGHHIHAPGHLANRSARRKRLSDDRLLLRGAPPPVSELRDDQRQESREPASEFNVGHDSALTSFRCSSSSVFPSGPSSGGAHRRAIVLLPGVDRRRGHLNRRRTEPSKVVDLVTVAA